MAPEGHAGAGGWRLVCRSKGRIRVVVWADEERAMSKGLSRWSMWTAVLAVAAGMSLVASAWAGEAKGKTQNVTNAVAEVSAQGEVSAITARLQEVEAQIAKVEDRFEDYRRSQDNTLKEMFVQWSGLLIAAIRERFNENAKKELESIREQNKFVLDENGKTQEKTIAEVQTELSVHIKDQWKSITIFGFIVLLIIIAVFSLVCSKVFSKIKMSSYGLYRMEMFLLMGVILLIFWGTFQLLSRIIDLGTGGSSIHAIVSPDCNQAVLQAYEQLSNELGRWCALFGVLGTFFGLVLPVGAYLLQLKVVNQREEQTAKLIKEEVRKFKLQKRQIEARLKDSDAHTQQIIEEKICNVESKVETHVQRVWTGSVLMQHSEVLKSFYVFQEQIEANIQMSAKVRYCRQWLLGIILALKGLSQINNDEFVRDEISAFINELKGAKNFVNFTEVRNATKEKNNLHPWRIEDWADVLRERFSSEMKELGALLAEYGIMYAE